MVWSLSLKFNKRSCIYKLDFQFHTVYVDIDTMAEAPLQYGFTFDGAGTRRWQIKNTFIKCFSIDRPPSGCLQYFTSSVGRIKSFNFDAVQSTHLADQMYSICIRQNRGTYVHECKRWISIVFKCSFILF